MNLFRLFVGAACAAGCAWSVDTRVWTQSEAAEFEKGTLKGVALSSNGRLTLAPVFQELFESGVPLLWAAASDAQGNVYAAGAEGKLYTVGRDGKGRLLATLTGGDVYALAVNRRNELFAATAPEGKIWKIVNGKPELFYDTKQRYVWALAFDADGRLYAGAGDSGQVHRISPDGSGAVFFDSGETHIRSMAFDLAGNLIVGTEPGGLVIRVSRSGEGFVLHQTGRREVTALAVAADGVIYAAGVGPRSAVPVPAPQEPAPAVPVPTAPGGAATQAVAARAAAPPTLAPSPAVSLGSDIFRIAPDGAPLRVWTHAQHIVYSLDFDPQQRLLAGTGNTGVLVRIDSPVVSTRLLDTEAGQLTALVPGAGGSLIVATANPGKLFRLGPALEKTGTAESDVFDANLFTYWGRIRHEGQTRGGAIAFETRSGNLDRPTRAWSPYQAPVDGRIVSPPARFLMWRATLTAAPDGTSPELSLVEAAYQAKNAAPQIERVEVTPANYKFGAGSTLSSSSNTLSLPAMGLPRRSAAPAASTDGGQALTMTAEHGAAGVRWKASDPNGDTLEATVEIRGRDESEWKLLKSGLRDNKYWFDSTSWPDGEYRLRVTVSDAPDNYAAEALTARMETEPFLIDNTPPAISALAAGIRGQKLVVTFRAADAHSPLAWAQVSINGGEWTWAAPSTRLTDSTEHSYSLEVERPAGSEITIAVKASDERDNVAARKLVLRP